MSRLEELTNWVREQHAGQVIKRTEQPYFDHLIFVANTVKELVPFGYEIGLCHDLFEKTVIKPPALLAALLSFGYQATDANYIVTGVQALTNVYTKKAYPDLSKKDRKQKEDDRLATISADFQTVKYADLIYNINWMLTYSRADAPSYLRKKQKLLLLMDQGDQHLRKKALQMINDGLAS